MPAASWLGNSSCSYISSSLAAEAGRGCFVRFFGDLMVLVFVFLC